MQSTTLISVLTVLIIASGFFSASETAMMAINRYKLKHASKTNATAKLILKLLGRPDRLLTIILLGNNFTNIFAASIATMIGFRISGEFGGFVASLLLTLVILLFAEITPKVIVSQKPEWLAYFAAKPLHWLIILFFPLVWLANFISSISFRLMGLKSIKRGLDNLTVDELRTVVHDSGATIPRRHKDMLSGILDLEKVNVNDIMIPKSEIRGINIADSEAKIIKQLRNSEHNILPIYRGEIDNILGFIRMRELTALLTEQEFSKKLIMRVAQQPYYIPDGTDLYRQLFKFQNKKLNFGLVVNEYGELIGLVTLADILEEIVGEFTTDLAHTSRIIPQAGNSYLVDGAIQIRNLNQSLNWDIPSDSAKTLSGAIIAYLEMIPPTQTCLLLHGYPIEIIAVQDNMIKTCKISAKQLP